MKYGEAKKQIEQLSSKYSIDMSDGDFVVYKGRGNIAYVSGYDRYAFAFYDGDVFPKLPYSNKLYMILSELAMTPLNERVDNKKYYVKVCDSISGYLNINIVTGKTLMMVGSAYETEFIKTKFTDKDIEKLKQRDDIPLDWNKVTLVEAE